MKTFLLFGLIALSSFSLVAQSIPAETKVKFIDKEKRAASFEVPYSADIVEKAIENQMATNGTRPEKVRGYTLYRGVKMQDSTTERADLYFKVERKSRKDKNSSLIYVFAINANENAQAAESDDRQLEASKEYLSALVPAIEATDLDANVTRQTAEIKDAERKLNRLQDDYSDMENRMKSLNGKMDENKKNQDRQSAEIEKLKAFLDALKGKKGS